MAAVQLGKRLVAGPEAAAEVGNADVCALKSVVTACRKSSYAGAAAQPEAALEQRLAHGRVSALDREQPALRDAPPFGEILSA